MGVCIELRVWGNGMSVFNKWIVLMVVGIVVFLSGCFMMKGDDEMV